MSTFINNLKIEGPDAPAVKRSLDLAYRSFLGYLYVLVICSASLFIPAGTINFERGWAFIATLTICFFGVAGDLLLNDQDLLERRIENQEIDNRQKIIRNISLLFMVMMCVFAGSEYRYGNAIDSKTYMTMGHVLFFLGFLGIAIVFRTNTFTAATIRLHPNQQVISHGPYAFVRHPMYTSCLLIFLGVVMALGSVWGFIPFVGLAAILYVRAIYEEEYLKKELEGYDKYASMVKNRIIPFLL
jgi:protein-S-isoprenylcysteine O-methyltransferase Ste14